MIRGRYKMKLLLTLAGFENPKVGKKFWEVVEKPAHEIKWYLEIKRR